MHETAPCMGHFRSKDGAASCGMGMVMRCMFTLCWLTRSDSHFSLRQRFVVTGALRRLAQLDRSHLTRRRLGPRSPAGLLTAPTCGHRKSATDDAGPGLHLEQIHRNEIIDTMCPYNAWTNLPHTAISKIFHFGRLNIPLGWKKLSKVALIEEVSLQWILKSRTLIWGHNQEK